jgi:hypothetical protein
VIKNVQIELEATFGITYFPVSQLWSAYNFGQDVNTSWSKNSIFTQTMCEVKLLELRSNHSQVISRGLQKIDSLFAVGSDGELASNLVQVSWQTKQTVVSCSLSNEMITTSIAAIWGWHFTGAEVVYLREVIDASK